MTSNVSTRYWPSVLAGLVVGATVVYSVSEWRKPATSSQDNANSIASSSDYDSAGGSDTSHQNEINVSNRKAAVVSDQVSADTAFGVSGIEESSTPASTPSTKTLPAPQAVETGDDLAFVLSVLDSAEYEDILNYLSSFASLNPENVYLPAAYKAGIEQLARRDFEAALDYILTELAGGQTAGKYWSNLGLSILGEQDPEYVSQSIALVSTVFNDAGSRDALNTLAVSLDPGTVATKALQHIRDNGDTSDRYALLSDALRSWALVEPHAALRFAQTEFADKTEREEYVSDVLYRWLEHNPDDARDTVQQILDQELAVDPDAYFELASFYANETSKTDPVGAYTWLLNQENEILREVAVGDVLSNWVQAGDASILDELIQINQQELGSLVSVEQQLNLTEDIIVALIDQGRQQQAVNWVNNHANQQIAQWGRDILDHLSISY